MLLLLLLCFDACSHPSLYRCGTSARDVMRLAILRMVFQTVLATFAGSNPPRRYESLGADCKIEPRTFQTFKPSCIEDFEQGIWKWSTLADVKREGNIEPIWQRCGEGGWGQTERHANVHTNASVHMNGEHETAEKPTVFIWTPPVRIRKRTLLTGRPNGIADREKLFLN